MSRPTTLDLSSVIRALSFTAQKPSVLAEKLKASRATVHRKLQKLLEDGLVVRTGQGPQAGYRLPTPEEEFTKERLAGQTGSALRLSMSSKTAYLVRDALESFSRFGIGQFEELLKMAREDALVRASGERLDLDAIEDAEPLLSSLKANLIGMSMHSSFGIYSPHVQPDVRAAWSLCRALRHRLAWDYTPEGSMGVWHDEPLTGDHLASLVVVSEGPVGKDHLNERRYHMEMDLASAKVVETAMRFQSRLLAGELEVIIELVSSGTVRQAQGERVQGPALDIAGHILNRLKETLYGQQGVVSHRSANATLLAQLADCAKEALVPGFVAGGRPETTVAEIQTVVDSPFSFTLEELPKEMFVSFKNGKYRVIGPSAQDDYLVILGESHSLQTAVLMARNAAAGGRTRSTSF
jgi:biotin operon repressor